MVDDHYMIISVAYEPNASSSRSLDWIAPELRNAGLTLIGENNGSTPSRTWAGRVDGPKFEHFADAWQLPDEPAENGHPGTQSYTFDGLNWETDGESPIVYVTLHVS